MRLSQSFSDILRVWLDTPSGVGSGLDDVGLVPAPPLHGPQRCEAQDQHAIDGFALAKRKRLKFLVKGKRRNRLPEEPD
jgi:hypothetical protein